MKVIKPPKFLKIIMGIMICVALIRAVNGAGEISITDNLLDIQNFRFDFTHVTEMVQFFKDGEFSQGVAEWDKSMTGIDGFFYNLMTVLSSFFIMISNVIKVVIVGIWNILSETIRLLGNVLNLILKIVGITE